MLIVLHITATVWLGGHMIYRCAETQNNHVACITINIPEIILVVSENYPPKLENTLEKLYFAIINWRDVFGMNCKTTWELLLCDKWTVCYPECCEK